jgi:hypothetical protein
LRSQARGERDRAAGSDVFLPVAHHVHLTQQLVGERGSPILVSQLSPRLVTRRSASANDPVEFAEAFEQRGKRFRVGNVDPFA